MFKKQQPIEDMKATENQPQPPQQIDENVEPIKSDKMYIIEYSDGEEIDDKVIILAKSVTEVIHKFLARYEEICEECLELDIEVYEVDVIQ